MTIEEHRAHFFRNESKPNGLRLSLGEIFDVEASKLLAELRELDWTDEDSAEAARARYLGHWSERLRDDKASFV